MIDDFNSKFHAEFENPFLIACIFIMINLNILSKGHKYKWHQIRPDILFLIFLFHCKLSKAGIVVLALI